MSKKGQASLEFLMTYGWAIVIIAVVMVVVWQWGIFNTVGNVRETKLGFWGMTPIDSAYYDNGTLIVALQNNIVEGDINVTSIDVEVNGETHGYVITSDSARNITAGNVYTWSAEDLPLLDAGGGYSVWMAIHYQDNRLGSDQTFQSTGTLQGTVQTE